MDSDKLRSILRRRKALCQILLKEALGRHSEYRFWLPAPPPELSTVFPNTPAYTILPQLPIRRTMMIQISCCAQRKGYLRSGMQAMSTGQASPTILWRLSPESRSYPSALLDVLCMHVSWVCWWSEKSQANRSSSFLWSIQTASTHSPVKATRSILMENKANRAINVCIDLYYTLLPKISTLEIIELRSIWPTNETLELKDIIGKVEYIRALV